MSSGHPGASSLALHPCLSGRLSLIVPAGGWNTSFRRSSSGALLLFQRFIQYFQMVLGLRCMGLARVYSRGKPPPWGLLGPPSLQTSAPSSTQLDLGREVKGPEGRAGKLGVYFVGWMMEVAGIILSKERKIQSDVCLARSLWPGPWQIRQSVAGDRKTCGRLWMFVQWPMWHLLLS